MGQATPWNRKNKSIPQDKGMGEMEDKSLAEATCAERNLHWMPLAEVPKHQQFWGKDLAANSRISLCKHLFDVLFYK